jgi:hypothetical protein
MSSDAPLTLMFPYILKMGSYSNRYKRHPSFFTVLSDFDLPKSKETNMIPNQDIFSSGHQNHSNNSTVPESCTSPFSASYYSPIPALSHSLAPPVSLPTPLSMYLGFSEENNDSQARNTDSALFYPLPTAETSRAVSGFETPIFLPEDFSVPEIPLTTNGVPAAMTSFFFYEATTRPSPNLDSQALKSLTMSDIRMLMDDAACDGCRQMDPLLLWRPHHERQAVTDSATPHELPRAVIHYATAPNGTVSFVCSDCNGQYGRRQDCNRHITSAHVKTKTFFCRQDGCSGSFCRADVLKRHLRNVHHIL